VASALPTVLAGVANVPQPRLLWSGQVVAANPSFMGNDPTSCPTAGFPTCQYNNATVLNNWVDSLVDAPPQGLGLKNLDINVWVTPLFTSRQYNANGNNGISSGGMNYCGTYGSCYAVTGNTGGVSNQAWYYRSLGTLDAMFAHIAAKGVRVRLAPMFDSTTLAVCGIGTGRGNFTESQLEQCGLPLWAAMAQRWHIDDFTLIHEPCGIMATVMGTTGCALSVSDVDTFILHAASAVRATQSQGTGIRTGAGALIAEATAGYWADWYTNLLGSLDFFGWDIYPDTAASSSSYGAHLASYLPYIASALALGKAVVVNESSGFRWAPLASGEGEAGTYWGCASWEWYQDGSKAWWVNAVPGAWAAANGISIFSVFPTEDLMLLTTSQTDNHCTSSDAYMTSLGAALNSGTSISPQGIQYAAMAAGWNTSLQGNAHLTGNAHLGH
jgi:hypothetical protein